MLTPQQVEDYYAQIGVVVAANRGDWRDGACPWHDDRSKRSFTFNVKSGGWKCHASCERSGAGHGGLKEAAEISGIPFSKGAAPDPARAKAKSAEPVLERSYDYKDEQGNLVYQVLRYKKGDSKTFRQRHPDGQGGWLWKMDGVRVLPYRLPELLAAAIEPKALVFVVEGEKDVDNLLQLGLSATTNHGGAGKWRKEHAAHLAGRRVVILPDNDAPGKKHAEQVAQCLQGLALEVRLLDLPGLPAKGDVSDWLVAGGTKEALLEAAAQAPLWTPRKAAEAAPAVQEAPFVCLGYSDGVYYYLPRGTSQVAALTPSNHSKLGLLTLAPLSYWVKVYGSDNGGIAWTGAASDCMTHCARQGVFNPLRIRGRGAWHENGRPVVHLGDAIVVDGQRRPVGTPEPGGYIYPAAVPMPIDYANPLDAPDAAVLSQFCDRLSWERPIHGRLLAGWLAIAPICGALSWRPHIWITGAAGTGKSWVMDNIMRPILGRVGLFVQGDTTEAGIRQALGYDARPVLFDEAEGESERSQSRMQNVLALMRQSSSENGSVIVKGTMSGAVKIYCIRCCFAFSSIGVGIKQHSDSTRVSVLALRKNEAPNAAEIFAAIKQDSAELLTPAWVGRLHARMITLIPVVRANAEVFAIAAARHIGSQRMGDQVGALLAGAYALHSDKEISRAEAQAWIEKQDWAEQTTIQESPDETLCLQRILQHLVRVPDNHGRVEQISVGEMIDLATSTLDPEGNAYRLALMRLGIRVDQETVTIASQHTGIQEILSGTPWGDWGRILRRLPGATATPAPVRFAGLRARGTAIPREAISN